MQEVFFNKDPWKPEHPLILAGERVQVSSFVEHSKFSRSTVNNRMKDAYVKIERKNFIHISDLCKGIKEHDLIDQSAIADLQSLIPDKHETLCWLIFKKIKRWVTGS